MMGLRDWFAGDPATEMQRLRARVRELEGLVSEAAELGERLDREQAARVRLGQQIDRERASYELTAARIRELEALLGEREASALDKLTVLPPARSTSPTAEVLRERARADALALRVEELQAANLRLYKIHIP
ncbi:hypothetical protein [Planomonospora venezuelensis]|uniref:Uncharacterized protein n=1 Tax=Planomonospora venezuelensis TaxID=1999 RepID=A0A841D903_PLAVE|nr:hypothetical protein [Planomonospora venezuelensis]MBB5965077.1 hypothetical protein [Planomonospora venezuelensis]